MEWYREGRVPLHTLRADVDFGVATAKTTYGTCGVKVWVFKGEILAHDPMAQDKRAQEQQAGALKAVAQSRYDENMLSPKRTKYRKAHKGRIHGAAKGGTALNFGAYGLKAVEPEPDHRAPDRGGAPRHHPPSEARSAASGSASSRTCRCRPSRPRCAWASGKGSPEFWVAGSIRAASCSRSTACRATVAQRGLRAGRRQAADQDRFVTRLGEEGGAMKAEDLRAKTPDQLKGELWPSCKKEAVQPALPAGQRPAREHGAGPRRCGATSPASRPSSTQKARGVGQKR